MQIVRIFTIGGDQAIRLPASCRLEASEVYVRRDPETGDVVLSRRPPTWSGLIDAVQMHDDFLNPTERSSLPAMRNPFTDSSS